MKLRTELREQSPLTCDFDALKHDAAAAHALMEAMYEVKKETPYASLWTGIEYAQERASELMREWGFDTGEDA